MLLQRPSDERPVASLGPHVSPTHVASSARSRTLPPGAKKGPTLQRKVYSSKRKKKRKRKRSKPQSWAKKYGPLRHFCSKLPWWVARLEVLTVYVAQQLLATALVAGLAIEASASIDSAWASRYKKEVEMEHRHRVASRRLGAIAWDAGLPMLSALQTLFWMLGFYCLSDAQWACLRRLGVLQAFVAVLLHIRAVRRWKTCSSPYQAPPLFALLAYGALPLVCFCVWLVSIAPGDHKLGGSIEIDMIMLAMIFSLRAILFGPSGLPRCPLIPRGITGRLYDLTVLGVAAVAFDGLLLRSAWIEDVKNWKYIFCALVLLLAWHQRHNILGLCRQESAFAWAAQHIQPSAKRRRLAQPAPKRQCEKGPSNIRHEKSDPHSLRLCRLKRGVAERRVFAFACQYVVPPHYRTGFRPANSSSKTS